MYSTLIAALTAINLQPYYLYVLLLLNCVQMQFVHFLAGFCGAAMFTCVCQHLCCI